MKQRTLKSSVSATGVGLHTGVAARVTLRPAPPNTGIVFRRIDLPTVVEIKAIVDNVCDTRLAISLVKDGVRVCSVELLLSAFAGLGIDNAYVDLTGPEVPSMDGSADPFVLLLRLAGIEEQRELKTFIRVCDIVKVRGHDGSWARLEPFNGFKLDSTIDYPHPVFGSENRHILVDFNSHSYEKDLARARSFSFLQDLEAMRDAGFALGSSLRNGIWLDTSRVLNSEGLRYDNEFVRHEVVDAIGDLSLLACPLLGAYTSYRADHSLNHALVRALLGRQESWDHISYDAVFRGAVAAQGLGGPHVQHTHTEARNGFRPPVVAEGLLYFILPKHQRECLPGDLQEECETTLVPKFGHRYARYWYWGQTFATVLERAKSLIEWVIGTLFFWK